MLLRTNLKIFYFSYWSIIVYFIMVFPMQLQKQYETYEIGIIIGSLTFFRFLSINLFKHIEFTKLKIYILNNLYVLLCILVYLSQDNFYLVLFFATLFGIVNNFVISYFDQIKIKTYRKYLGLFRVFGSFGGFSLFLVIIAFPSLIKDMSLLFYTYMFIYFVVSNTILYQRKKVLQLHITSEKSNQNIKTTNAFSFWLIGGVVMIFMSFFHTFIGVYLSIFGYSEVDTSILLSVGIFFEIIAFFTAHHLFKLYSFNQLFLVASLITGLRLLFFDLFIDNFILLCVIQAFHFFTFGLFYASFMNILKNIYKSNINEALQIFNGYIDGILKSILIFVLAYFLYYGVFAILGVILIALCLVYYKQIR